MFAKRFNRVKRNSVLLLLSGFFLVSHHVFGQTTFSVTASGMLNYTINSSSDPVLTLTRGVTYMFEVNASGHPFYIKTNGTAGTGDVYTNGVSGSGNGVENGTLIFTVPLSAPNTLFYHCSAHSAMGNSINVINPANTPPSVTITNPLNGTVFVAPANVLIQASASDPGGSVTNVEFRVGASTLANDATSPYSATTNNLPAGNYTLSAIASDNNGARATNSIDVVCNARPGVVITNILSGAKFAAPANISIQVSATDSDGTVTNVQFLSGGLVIGSDNTSPFSFPLNNAAAGNYSLSAIAADNYGTTATSAIVSAFVLTNSTITAITPLAGGQVQITISGIAGQIYATESSSNIPGWSAFTTNVAPTDIFNVTNSASGAQQLFYRARQDL